MSSQAVTIDVRKADREDDIPAILDLVREKAKFDGCQDSLQAALLSELCVLARESGCGRIDWIVARDNDGGRRFYERSGAHIFEDVRHARLDEHAIDTLIEKRIAPRCTQRASDSADIKG